MGDITMTDMPDWNEPRDQVLEPGVIEFYGSAVLCLVRKLSETGAALDMVRPCVVPDRFTLAFGSGVPISRLGGRPNCNP
jgi:hypothetical protein